MYIGKVLEITDEVFDAVRRLVPEIGAHKPLPARQELVTLARSEVSTLWIARHPDQSGPIAGMLTISFYRVPTGLRSIVEDVAVDPGFRRLGVARALMQTAIEFAREVGANGVALTSNPNRVAANQLYQSMGFKLRETNSYFYALRKIEQSEL